MASIVSQLICWICDICDNTLAAVASSSLDMAHTLFLAVNSGMNNRIGKVNTTLVNYMFIFKALIKKDKSQGAQTFCKILQTYTFFNY